MTNIIHFYRVSDEFGCFSNFAPYSIELDGKRWPTSEHYFQAQKFEDAGHREAIRRAQSPMIAARMGRDRKKKLQRGDIRCRFRPETARIGQRGCRVSSEESVRSFAGCFSSAREERMRRRRYSV